MPLRLKTLILWAACGIAGLVFFVLFFNYAFPVASIDIRLSKEEALKKASSFVQAQGFDLKGFDKALIFDSDDSASVYLQKTQGIKKSNELIRQGLPIWFWRIRWFKELKKVGFVVDVDPSSGAISGFYYSVLDDEKGVDLNEADARVIAEKTIAIQGIDLARYELKENTKRKQKERTDYYFSWEKKDYKIKDATLRVSVDIFGDKLGLYTKHLKIPEEFGRDMKKEESLGVVISMVVGILMFLLFIAAIIVLIIKYKQSKINWGVGFICAVLVAILTIATFLNSLSLLWIAYPDTVSKNVFIILTFGAAFIGALWTGLIILLYGSTGESLAHDVGKPGMPLWEAVKNKSVSVNAIMTVCVVGYSLGFAFLGYITLFYLVGTKFFNVWMPPESSYSNILGTTLPFLFPLTIAVTAAISEEFMFRLFTQSFFKKIMKFTWLAVLMTALIWAFAHSSYPVYPMYIRGIELTVFGVILGIVFLKYGLESVIIAHFVIDASLAGLPLIKSHNLYYIISGYIVIAFALLPVLIAAIIVKIRGQVCTSSSV